jgi:transposase
VNAEELIGLIPEEELEFLAAETKVDHQVKKLTGSLIFKLILYSMLDTERMSLRVMETLLLSARFRQFSQNEELTSRHSSIRDRIANINPEYFKAIFERLFSLYHPLLKVQDSLAIVDSTYVSLSAKLLNWGMSNGQKSNHTRQAKYTLCLKDGLPYRVKVFTDQRFISENYVLGGALEDIDLQDAVVVFDRGLQSRKALDKLADQNKLFIGRTKVTTRYKLTSAINLTEKPKDSSVTITKDSRCLLTTRNGHTTNEFRLIEALIDHSDEPICLVTNCFDLSAYEVAALYKKRWQIETFFKFLKQHLNLKHFVGRSQNAVQVLIYMTLITAMLIMVYRELNKLSGFKIAKLRFEIELDNFLLKEIVKLCGGDPAKAPHLWNSA